MTGIARFVAADDPWTDDRRERVIPDEAQCVLLWVQRAQQATDNRAANLAVEIGNALELPVVALFVLTPGYPDATLRSYQFMAEGLAELPQAFAARGIAWTLRVGDPPSVMPMIVQELHAGILVTDLEPLRVARGWKAAVAECATIPVVAVATDSIVPPSFFPNLESAARTIRPKLWRKVANVPHLLDAIPTTRAKQPQLRVDPGPDPLRVVSGLGFTRAEKPAELRGGLRAAQELLERFIAYGLAGYASLRNHPDRGHTSRLSAYLHFARSVPWPSPAQ